MLINNIKLKDMKFKYLILCLLFVSLFSCKEGDSYDISKVTTFAVFEEFDPIVIIQKGTAYTPDVVAKEGDNEIPVTVSPNLNVNMVGVYDVILTATNSEGYAGTATQRVIVYDPAALDYDLSGVYACTVVRTEADGSTPRTRNTTVNITEIARGVFYVDCLLGAYYSIGAGYGSDYAMTGYISLESDLSVRNLQSFVSAWGDGLETFHDGSYDSGTGALYWESEYAAEDIFHVTLTK
jgi:hypothetical protein